MVASWQHSAGRPVRKQSLITSLQTLLCSRAGRRASKRASWLPMGQNWPTIWSPLGVASDRHQHRTGGDATTSTGWPEVTIEMRVGAKVAHWRPVGDLSSSLRGSGSSVVGARAIKRPMCCVDLAPKAKRRPGGATWPLAGSPGCRARRPGKPMATEPLGWTREPQLPLARLPTGELADFWR